MTPVEEKCAALEPKSCWDSWDTKETVSPPGTGWPLPTSSIG